MPPTFLMLQTLQSYSNPSLTDGETEAPRVNHHYILLLSQPSTPEVLGVLLYPPQLLGWCCPSCWRPAGREGSRSDRGAPAGRPAPGTQSALRCCWRSPAADPGTRDQDLVGSGVAIAAPAFRPAAGPETSPPPPATAARTGGRRGACGSCRLRGACPEPAPATAAAPAAPAAIATTSNARLSRRDPSQGSQAPGRSTPPPYPEPVLPNAAASGFLRLRPRV